MKIENVTPKIANWDNVSAFMRDRYIKWPACTVTFFQEAERNKIDALMFLIFAAIRSEGFESEAYRKRMDIFNLGQTYTTFRHSIEEGAVELAKMDDSTMFADDELVKPMYQAMIDHCLGLPSQEPPPPPPSKPTEPLPPPKPDEPTPIPVPVPKPEDPEPIPTKPPEKDSGSWFSKNWKLIAGAILTVLIGACAILPVPSFVATMLKLALQALKTALGL